MSFEDFKIERNKKLGAHKFSSVFKNLENCKILWKVFGSKEKFLELLQNQKVRVSKKPWVFWVNDKTKEITIFVDYLKECPKKTLYLDCIHELVHVKQMQEGKDLFDNKFPYVDRQTEIEAYHITAQEARRIGMTKRQIANYLEVSWATDEENARLVRTVLSKL